MTGHSHRPAALSRGAQLVLAVMRGLACGRDPCITILREFGQCCGGNAAEVIALLRVALLTMADGARRSVHLDHGGGLAADMGLRHDAYRLKATGVYAPVVDPILPDAAGSGRRRWYSSPCARAAGNPQHAAKRGGTIHRPRSTSQVTSPLTVRTSWAWRC
jgi:hypothetical protein